MKKANLIKSGVLVSAIAVATMFGFSDALGYGGGGVSFSSPCSEVVYGNWGSCANGKQYRDIVSSGPANCVISAGQQLERQKYCETAIAQKEDKEDKTPIRALVVKSKNVKSFITTSYAAGTLLRGDDKRIYVVLGNGSLQYIATMNELAKYKGQIMNVENGIISSFKKVSVLGAKKYGDGTLLRAKGEVKTYVVKNGKKVHIKTLAEFKKMNGKVVTVDTATLNSL